MAARLVLDGAGAAALPWVTAGLIAAALAIVVVAVRS